jgi:hypothetical protein
MQEIYWNEIQETAIESIANDIAAQVLLQIFSTAKQTIDNLTFSNVVTIPGLWPIGRPPDIIHLDPCPIDRWDWFANISMIYPPRYWTNIQCR